MAIGVLAAGVAAQFYRPARTNETIDPGRTVESLVGVTPAITAIFERSCRDCHSERTEWPWYSNVAPVSWFVIDHVTHGRSHLNLSRWDQYDRAEASRLLEETCKLVRAGEMPLPSYTWIHRAARLSPTDADAICRWSETARARSASGQVTATRPTP
jgi:hypothetical protein